MTQKKLKKEVYFDELSPNISDIICQPAFKNNKKLKNICAPLSQTFGLDSFWYFTLTDQGEYSYISNCPDLAVSFFSNSLYVGHPFFKHTSLLQSGVFLADKTTDNDYLLTQAKFEFTQLFVAINVGNGKVQNYGFATTQNLPDLSNCFINNLYLFRKFIHYFHQEAEDQIRQMKNYSVDMVAACKEAFYKPTQYFNTITSKVNTHEFHKKIDPKQYQELHSLSMREKECLRWFLKGMSAVQIGKKIHLSNRTVEFYLENIKNKLACNTKQELFEILLNSPDFLTLTFF